MQDYQYHHEASGGFRLQTNGISLYAEYGWIRDLKKTRLIQIEYSYYIDYAQKKQKSLLQDGTDFVYGLQNHFHAIRFSYGVKQTIWDKADKNGVRLCLVAYGGITMGLLKPYYLNVNVNYNQPDSPITTKNIRYRSASDSLFLNSAAILSAAPLRYGLNQMQPVPGLHGKVGLNFDWGSKDEFIKVIEAGVMLDVYYKVLPIMINDSNRFYQLAAYISIDFGKRW
jgi:hypothetical protein